MAPLPQPALLRSALQRGPPTPTTLAPTTAPATESGINIVSVSSPVDAGAYVSLVAQTSPDAVCNLSVVLPSGRESQSSGTFVITG